MNSAVMQARQAMNHGSAHYLLASICLALVANCGCGSKPATAVGDKSMGQESVATLPAFEGTPSASEVLRTLLTTYREAKSYADNGKVVLRFRQNGEVVENEWPSAVGFERPNCLFTKANQ